MSYYSADSRGGDYSSRRYVHVARLELDRCMVESQLNSCCRVGMAAAVAGTVRTGMEAVVAGMAAAADMAEAVEVDTVEAAVDTAAVMVVEATVAAEALRTLAWGPA